jgi:hypothetical protein
MRYLLTCQQLSNYLAAEDGGRKFSAVYDQEREIRNLSGAHLFGSNSGIDSRLCSTMNELDSIARKDVH